MPRAIPEEHERLVACLHSRYAAATGLRFHEPSISRDMNNYHAFEEIDARTPAAIIEVGFMYLDRQMLTADRDRVAQGIADGIKCFLQQ
jgi:N-acetylmuramoyl-L-alanine amidase